MFLFDRLASTFDLWVLASVWVLLSLSIDVICFNMMGLYGNDDLCCDQSDIVR